MDSSIFIGFLLSIVLGGLIGAEREIPRTHTKKPSLSGFGWIRTYASIAFFGAIATWLDQSLQSHIWILFWAIMSWAFIFLSYGYSAFARDKVGATSEYAGLITYFIGVIVLLGKPTFAVILTISLLLLLSAKEYFYELKTRFSREELGDSLKFAVIALVVLPLLPDIKYSILDVTNWIYQWNLAWTHPVLVAKFFNPYGIWMFVVIMAGVEYAGFLLSRMIGSKWGIIASGAIGGIISSTATTVAMAHKSKEHIEHRNSYVVATLVSSCIMLLRVIIVAGVIYPAILWTIFFPSLAMFLGLLIVSWYFHFFSPFEKWVVSLEREVKAYESPFQLLPAIQFAGLIVVIKFLSILGSVYQNQIPPEISNYGLALISGLADVDAINMAYSGNAKAGITTLIIAATTILIAVMSNNVVKASIAYRFWEKEYGKRVALGFITSISFWLLALLLIHFI